ncbi:MAG TPA: hypothetical protein VI160_02665 [Gemmatimonadales bacterium]
MSSATSSTVSETLAAYLAGRAKAERVVAEVAAAYYRDGGRGTGEGLRPIVEVIERAHPGVVELSASGERPGYAVKLAERPFPKQFDPELRTAVERVLSKNRVSVAPSGPASGAPRAGFFGRIVQAIRRVFS